MNTPILNVDEQLFHDRVIYGSCFYRLSPTGEKLRVDPRDVYLDQIPSPPRPPLAPDRLPRELHRWSAPLPWRAAGTMRRIVCNIRWMWDFKGPV